MVVSKRGCPLQIQQCSTCVASLVFIAVQGRIEEECTSPHSYPGSISRTGFGPRKPGPNWMHSPGSLAKEGTESLGDSQEMATSLTSCVWLQASGGTAPLLPACTAHTVPFPTATVGGGGRQASRAREASVATTHRIKAPQPGPDHLRREPGMPFRNKWVERTLHSIGIRREESEGPAGPRDVLSPPTCSADPVTHLVIAISLY